MKFAVALLGLSAASATIVDARSPAMQDPLRWESWGALPKATGEMLPVGRAGTCAGIAGGRLVVIGGSSFPEPAKTVSRGGAKNYYRDALIFDFASRRWLSQPDVVPAGLEQALSIPTGDGFLCVGGANASGQAQRSIFMVEVSLGGRLETRTFAVLPMPIAAPAGQRIGTHVLLAQGNRLLDLDLSRSDRGWRDRAAIPWVGRKEFASARVGNTLFVMGGRRDNGHGWQVLRDVYSYDLCRDEWKRRADLPIPLSSTTTMTLDSGSFFLISGVEEETSNRFYTARRALETAPAGSDSYRARAAELTMAYDQDPGFSAAIFRYVVRRNTWLQSGWHPGPPAVKRSVIYRDGSVLLVGGETNPGKRTAAIWQVALGSTKARIVRFDRLGRSITPPGLRVPATIK